MKMVVGHAESFGLCLQKKWDPAFLWDPVITLFWCMMLLDYRYDYNNISIKNIII